MVNSLSSQDNNVIIYIWKDMAYVPVQDCFESGLYTLVDPVYTSLLTVDSLVKAVREVKAIGHKIIPSPKTHAEFKARKDVLLCATGARSWKELARSGNAYAISWTKEHIRMEMTRLDKQGRWEYDPNKAMILPPDTSIEEIVRIVIKDHNER